MHSQLGRICLSAGVKFAVSNKPVRILKVTRFWYLLMRLFHALLQNGMGNRKDSVEYLSVLA